MQTAPSEPRLEGLGEMSHYGHRPWIQYVRLRIENCLEERGYSVKASIDWRAAPASFASRSPTPAHRVLGARGGATRVTLVCRLVTRDLSEASRLYTDEGAEQTVRSLIEDLLPPDWTSRLVFVQPLPQGLAEFDAPRFSLARLGRFQLVKGKRMELPHNPPGEPMHPMVQVLLEDVWNVVGAHIDQEVWERVRSALEDTWRRRLRHRVDEHGVIYAEEWELMQNSIAYLFERLGFEFSRHARSRKESGISTRPPASASASY